MPDKVTKKRPFRSAERKVQIAAVIGEFEFGRTLAQVIAKVLLRDIAEPEILHEPEPPWAIEKVVGTEDRGIRNHAASAHIVSRFSRRRWHPFAVVIPQEPEGPPAA